LQERIGGEIVSVLASSAVNRGFKLSKTMQVVFVASPLSTQY